ncbi:MAG: thiamine diphosphokinase [Coxiellaceae bacterium]|jgi:thiamine pyrophosphokinase|nr:thiamine diphosphokinase [Coxiellaceae bacterium]
MKAVIVAGGIPPSKRLVMQEIMSKSIIIAADSGANCLWQYKITPNFIIGDCDSIDKKILKFWSNNNVTIECHPPEKDLTDTELALNKAIDLNPEKIAFLGCLGGNRIDHLLGSMGLLDKCLSLNINAHLKDDYQTIVLLKKAATIYGHPGQMFSLQAYGGNVKDLSLKGSKYLLNNYLLKMGDTLTLSNEFKNKIVNIQFRSGKLLVIVHINA